MSYEKLVMYLTTIPNYDNDEDDENKGSSSKKETATGSFNLFDFDTKF